MDKRYLIVAGAIVVQAVTVGCVFAYGVFFTTLEAVFGWSRTLLSVATAIAFFNMGLFALPAGRLSDRFGPTGVLSGAALCTGLAYVLMYFLSAPWQLLLIYGLLVGVGLATHDVVTLSTVARWFPRRRGAISGVVKVGTAIGQMTIPLAAVALISSLGWRVAFVVMGSVAAILLLLAALLMGIRPAVHSDVQPATNSTNASLGIGLKQARQGRNFWMLCGIQFFYFGILISVPTHIVPHAMDNGLSAVSAATVLSTIAGCSIAGRLLIGGFVDRIGGKLGFNIALSCLLLSLISLMFIEDANWLYAFGALYGFAHGGLFTVVSPTVAEYFGMKEHGAIFGGIVFTGTVFGAALPIITGMVYDRLQSYQLAFALMAFMALISLVLSLCLKKSAAIVQTANEPD